MSSLHRNGFNDRITGKLHAFAQTPKIVHIDIITASISKNIHVRCTIMWIPRGSEKMLEYARRDTIEWIRAIVR